LVAAIRGKKRRQHRNSVMRRLTKMRLRPA
jgi:hypothetical protein